MIHPSADVSPRASLGAGTMVWHEAQIREGASLGKNCIVGKSVYVDHDVQIGNNVKLQNRASIFHGSRLEDGVFIGPHACLTNDLYPRAINPDGSLKDANDWGVGTILVKRGAAIGAGAIVLPGVTIGSWSLVGAGSVVTRDVADHTLVVGNPARQIGYVCPTGHRLEQARDGWRCVTCDWQLPEDASQC